MRFVNDAYRCEVYEGSSVIRHLTVRTSLLSKVLAMQSEENVYAAALSAPVRRPRVRQAASAIASI